VSRQTPSQPALPFDPPLDLERRIPEDPGDEIPLERFTSILLQEVVRRSVALELQPRRRTPRSAA
jgi:hypothetical protein